MNRPKRMTLAVGHGRTLQLNRHEGADEVLEVRDRSGELELSIVFTSGGPTLRVRAAELELEATRAIRMKCERFELEAEREARIAAPRGTIALVANDDVDVKGERILLNADAQPIPASWEEFLGPQEPTPDGA
jgi:hypothetical protein